MSTLRRRPNSALTWRGSRSSATAYDLADPFSVNPIRRSFALVAGCAAIVFGPLLLGPEALTLVMLSVGWLAVSGLVIGTPILLWSLAEAGLGLLRQRVRPTVNQLDLSSRVVHILLRHGYEAIASVDRAPDGDLLLLANMDRRGLHELRRAITLWNYCHWQDSGFSSHGRE